MKKKIQKNKKIIFILSSFLLPFMILYIIFNLKGFFNNNAFISGDMLAQYFPLLNYFKDILNGSKDIFYNFNKSMGGTMFGTFFYYLSSPMNLLLFFINKINIEKFIIILTIIKLSLCGLTMYIYMSKKYKNNNLLILSLSCCYALMGYNINYSLHIMWLDVIFMTPLVLMGLEKIIEDKSPRLYMITLFISIFANYYLSYMLCLFCVIYFVYEVLLRKNLKKDKLYIKKITKKFLISSILTGLMCSFFLIPCIFEMTTYGRGVTTQKIITFDYNFFDIFSKTYLGSLQLNDRLNYSSMNLYCGTLISLLIFLFFYNDKIDKKERIISLITLLILILPCFIGIFNYIWHLFTIPNYYSYRYSYLTCFFILNISYKSLINIKIDIKRILLYLIFFLLISFYFILITYYGKYYSFLNYKKIWITIGILLVYIVLLKKNKLRKYIPFLVIIDLIINIGIIYYEYNPIKKTEIKKGIDINNNIMRYYDKEYRLGNELSITMNDSLIYDYSSPHMFLSTTNYNYIELTQKIIYDTQAYSNIYMYRSINPLFDMMIGNRIIVTKNQNSNYKKIDSIIIDKNKYYIYENPYALKLGYMVSERIKEDNNFTDLFDWQNKLFKNLTNNNLKYIDELKQNKKDRLYVNDRNQEYLMIRFGKNNVTSFKINEKEITSENIVMCDKTYCIIKNDFEDKINIEVYSENEKIDVKLGYFKYDNLKKVYKELKKNELVINEKNSNSIIGTINSTKEKKVLLLTLGYEKGFKIYIDNELVNYYNIYGFIGVDLPEGEHDIKIQYNQPHLTTGIIVSIIALITSIIYIEKKSKVFTK